ncbi:hypothetical protein [Peristeroidobacter soli]|uniref:hypothetical protein n=1 Tax=Peristeroidobacter soli TaxID=2497877 RepID=UPI001FEC42D2|nr:hypothetical protein [Peristeroidobacter soli]
MKRIAISRQTKQAREEAVDQRNLQLVSIRNLDAQQIRVLDVESAARTQPRIASVQAIIRQLTNAIDFNREVIERFARRIEDANARIGEQLTFESRDECGDAL